MRPWLILLPLAALIASSQSLFEDQVFKFDWKREFVGVPEQARFWETPRDAAVIVKTSSSVVAALDADTGAVRCGFAL
jgi:hypothetical protein